MTKEEYWNQKKTLLFNEARSYRAFELGVQFSESRIAELEQQIEKMKRCEICKHYQEGSCNYQFYSQQVCKENGMKLFEVKEIKENERRG